MDKLRIELLDGHLQKLTLPQIVQFVSLARQLKNDIILTQPANVSDAFPPAVLPPSVAYFLSDACGLPADSITHCWELLKDTIWQAEDAFEDRTRTAFCEFGYDRGLGMFS